MKNAFSCILITILFLNFSSLYAQTTIINEGFESWPPEGWSTYNSNLVSSWGQCFQNDCGHTGNYSAYNLLCNGGCEKWLVSPPISVSGENIVLSFWERFDESSLEYYDYSGVQISAGSGNPEDDEFIELFTTDPGEQPIDWIERTINLDSYNGQTVYIAFKFEGTWHEWFVDDVFVGPETFTDLGITSIVNPGGINQETTTEDIIISLANYGTEEIDDFVVNWSVNGIIQPPYNATGLNFQPEANIELTLGQYDFNTEGSYQIVAEIILSEDFNPDNNLIESTYYVLPPVDAKLSRMLPDGFSPVIGYQNVIVEVINNGQNNIDSLTVYWEIEEQIQIPYQASGLNLEPGASIKLIVGQYDFTQGVHKITARVYAAADTDADNDEYTVFNSVATFWESFEGTRFPPEAWTATWALKDKGFTLNPHGEYYYAGQSDNNFFGPATDTVLTPVMTITQGNQLRFFRKYLSFSPGNLTMIWQEGFDGQIHVLENISTTALDAWEEVVVDLSPAVGNNRIGFIVHSSGIGLQYLDLFTSDAVPYLEPGDLMVKDFESFYLAKIDEPHSVGFTVKNYSTSEIPGSNYTLKLMQAPGIELTSLQGVTLDAWEEADLEFNYTFTEIDHYSLYIEIVSAADPIPFNNTTRPETVHVVPQDIELIDIGQPDYNSLNFPFDFGGDTWTFSSNDISQSLYYSNEINTSGNIYGITYYSNNIIHTYQDLPLKVWAMPTNIDNFNAGWIPTEEMGLVFDGTIELIPGENTIYIPFEAPVLYSEANNFVIQHFQFSPEFPPGFGGIIASTGNGPVRTLSLINSIEADPNEFSEYYQQSTDYTFTTFVLQPVAEQSVISGTVYDENNEPFSNVNIDIEGQITNIQTDLQGNYTLGSVPYSDYTITATAFGYNDNVKNISVNQPLFDLDFFMELRPKFNLSGMTVGSNDLSTALQNVQVVVEGYDNYSDTTDGSGNFFMQNIYGNTPYSITFKKYGYYDHTITVDYLDENIDFGTIILEQEFISPYKVLALDQNSYAEITWQNPLTSEKSRLQEDLDVCSFSYTNEPGENVWLGNKIMNTETLTLTTVEVHWDYYFLDSDYVTIDIFDENEVLLGSSEPFLTQRDSTMTIDVPNLTLSNDFYVMVHWQNNDVNTHALCVDWTNGGNNAAYIKYPDDNMILLSDFIGDPAGAFHIRVNVLKDGDNSGVDPLYYNIFTGPVEEIQTADSWEKINTDPVFDTHFLDNNWPPVESGEVLYAVEAVYEEGASQRSFSNPISIIVGNEEMKEVSYEIVISPNPAKHFFIVDIKLSEVMDVSMNITNELGQTMEKGLSFRGDRIRHDFDVSSFPSGVYNLAFTLGTKRHFQRVVLTK